MAFMAKVIVREGGKKFLPGEIIDVDFTSEDREQNLIDSGAIVEVQVLQQPVEVPTPASEKPKKEKKEDK